MPYSSHYFSWQYRQISKLSGVNFSQDSGAGKKMINQTDLLWYLHVFGSVVRLPYGIRFAGYPFEEDPVQSGVFIF